jgi:hypothetical protein
VQYTILRRRSSVCTPQYAMQKTRCALLSDWRGDDEDNVGSSVVADVNVAGSSAAARRGRRVRGVTWWRWHGPARRERRRGAPTFVQSKQNLEMHNTCVEVASRGSHAIPMSVSARTVGCTHTRCIAGHRQLWRRQRRWRAERKACCAAARQRHSAMATT